MKTKTLPTLSSTSAGLTLLEIMIVLAIISFLAATAFPSLAKARKTARITRLITHLKTTGEAFGQYAAENAQLPQPVPGYVSPIFQIPPGMQGYLPKNSTWKTNTDGYWYYNYNPDALVGYKAFLYLNNSTLSEEDVTFLDKRLDNGNLTNGGLVFFPTWGLTYGLE